MNAGQGCGTPCDLVKHRLGTIRVIHSSQFWSNLGLISIWISIWFQKWLATACGQSFKLRLCHHTKEAWKILMTRVNYRLMFFCCLASWRMLCSLRQTVSTYNNLAHQLKTKWTRWQTNVVDGLKSIKYKLCINDECKCTNSLSGTVSATFRRMPNNGRTSAYNSL